MQDLNQIAPLLWITNHPKPIKGMWPRRFPVEYIEGAPKPTKTYSAEELSQQGLIGVYVNMREEEYRKLPIAKTPKDMPTE
jgi:hypothetical protein